jgi:hypothetical protein
MREAQSECPWYVDLIGVLLSASTISYLSYLGLRDSETGEVNPRILILSVALHFASYLAVYLLLLKRDDFLEVPNWPIIAIVGSVLCSISFRLPVNLFDLDAISFRAFLFSIITLVFMGCVRLLYWLIRNSSHTAL